MKQCPACRSQYTDDTLQFCLQDGTPLLPVPVERETETIVSTRSATPVYQPESTAARPERRRTGLIIFVTALSTLLLFGIIAAAYLISSRAGRQNAARDTANTTPVNTNFANLKQSPSPTVSPTAASNAVNANLQPTPDTAEISRNVTKAIAGWESDTESLDTDSLITRYADRVDYYRRPGSSRAAVKRDKERAFSIYDSVDLEISNIRITPGAKGDTATAEFDKAWVFDGESRSEGKVRSRLNLKRNGDQWLITGEQDIKVY